MAGESKKVSELSITSTLSSTDRVLVLTNPATSAQTQTVTISNFANSVANVIPVANTTKAGIVKVDGNTVVISNGTISVPTANTIQLGVVKVDGNTIVISNGTIRANVSTNNVGDFSFVNNNINLTQPINTDIVLNPTGTGLVSVPGLKIPVGSVIQNTIAISTVVADRTLLTVNNYSIDATAIPIGTIGNANTIPAPWTIYQLTSTPSPALQVDDVVGGAGVPANSAIQFVGSSTYGAYFVTNATFTGAPAANGINLTFARPVVNPSFQISTANSTDIALIAGANGHVVVNSDVVPATTNQFRLGTPANRFKELWLGKGTLYVLDETLGTDQAIGANNGNFYIKGGAGLSVGEFTFRDNTIQIANSARDIYVGSTLATGNVIFNRPIAVKSYDTAQTTFAVSRSGRVQVFAPNTIPAGDVGALSVIGSPDGKYQGVINPGGMLHITGGQDVVSRLTNDAFGVGAFPAYISRAARGSANTPSATQSGDILSRYSTVGYGTTNYPTGPAATNIEVYARENFTDTAQGTEYRFYTAPVGTTNKSLSTTINDGGISLVNSANAAAGIRFRDSSVQNTAFNSTSAVTRINVGTGLTQSGNTGVVGIDSNAALSIVGTANQVNVSNVGGNYTLSLPQNIGTNSTVQFNTLTVTNLTVTNTLTSAANSTLTNKTINLAYDSTSQSQIDAGGVTLGNTSSAYTVSILYNLSNNSWTTGNTSFISKNITATGNLTSNVGWFNNQLHSGGAYYGYDFPNATFQGDCNNNGYNQVVMQNHSSGTQASADFVAVNDTGNDSVNYIDLGINSSTYANNTYSIMGPNDGYLYINSANLVIGTDTTNKGIVFFAGGTATSNKIGEANSTGWFIDKLRVTNTINGSINGTANNTTYVGSVTAANVVSNAQLVANLANYQTTAGLSANVAALTSNNTSYVGSITAANVVSNAQLTANLANYVLTSQATYYVNTSQLSSNLANYISASQLSGNLANYVTITNFNSNLTNYVTATNLTNNLANYQTSAGLSANVATLTSNNTSYVGSTSAANVVSNAYLTTTLAGFITTSQLSGNLASYQTTAGLSANVATLTSNNTSYVGSVTAANVVSNAQLSANLANYVNSTQLSGNLANYVTATNLTNNLVNYQTSGGMASNVAVLTSNNTSYVGSVTAANVVSNAQLTANLANYQTTAGLNANVSALGYMNTASNYTVTGVHTHSANVVISAGAGLSANGGYGTAGQYLASNGSSVYWANTYPNMYVFSLESDRTLSTSNSAQSLFGVGVILNSNTKYRYKIVGTVYKANTSFSSTGALQFAITNSTANAVLSRNYFMANPCAANGSQSTLMAAFQMSQNITSNFNTPITITNSNTGATWYNVIIDGVIDVTTGGAVHPQIAFTHTGGLGTGTILQNGATMEIWPIGNATSNAVVGTWV